MILDKYIAEPLSRCEIRRYANHIKAKLCIGPLDKVDIVNLMENVMPELFKSQGYEFELLTREEMGNNHGLTDPISGKIYIREDIYEGACQGCGRDRLTMAHELGHYLLHNGARLGLARAMDNEEIPPYRDPEWQATAFAGEFLMDHDAIKSMDVNEIVERYGVSYAAAQYQKTH